jgi:ubiquinone/menaquinone biosynthesis C-methylase UbiE
MPRSLGAATLAGMAADTLWTRLGARIYDPFLALAERRGMASQRRALLASARGRVLELGAGTGLNLAHYPADIAELVLTEPEPGMAARLERRVARSGREATIVAASAEALPFPDGAFDTVVSTLVLCTVADPDRALAEVRRVLRPGGQLLFCEHVRSDSPRLARWQDRYADAWATVADGCRCNRDTLAKIGSRFEITTVERASWRGMPPLVHPLVVGVAAA